MFNPSPPPLPAPTLKIARIRFRQVNGNLTDATVLSLSARIIASYNLDVVEKTTVANENDSFKIFFSKT